MQFAAGPQDIGPIYYMILYLIHGPLAPPSTSWLPSCTVYTIMGSINTVRGEILEG